MTVDSREDRPASVPLTPLVICAPAPAEDGPAAGDEVRSVPALPLLIGGVPKPPTDLDGGQREVVLSFPAESVGMYVLTKHDEQPTYGYAQGEVRVPAGRSVQLNLSDSVTDGAVLAALPPDGVQVLTATGLGDDALDAVGRLRGLTYLHLGGGVSDAGLAKLVGLSNLTMLSASGSRITDAAVEHLVALPQLRSVHLSAVSLTDAGVAALAGLGGLLSVHVASPHLSNASVAALSSLTQLGTLSLESDGIDDAGLLLLANGYPELKQVTIAGASITNEGVFAAFSAGISAELNNQWFSPKAVERLRRRTNVS